MSEFHFVMRSGPTPGKVFPIEGTDITIGRDANQTISINDTEISRKHAKMTLRGSAYVIQDLGSTNGTFVNGNRISGIQVLNPNDIVSFGENIVLMYELVADPNATIMASKAPKTAAGIQKPAPAPASVPAPTPVYTTPAQTTKDTTPTKKGNRKLLIIIILVVILCIILGCLGLILWIDADPTGGRWCDYLPFIARWLGGVCPP